MGWDMMVYTKMSVLYVDVSENLQVVFLWDIVAVSQALNDNMQHPAAAVMAIIIVIDHC